MREQITWETEPVALAEPNPFSAEQLLIGKDVGGNENIQLHHAGLEERRFQATHRRQVAAWLAGLGA